MKKLLFFLALIFLFSCESKEKECTTCNTILKYPGGDVLIYETYACGEMIDKLDKTFSCVINPVTGEYVFYQMTICKK